MRRRLTLAIVAVTALTVVLLGVPLAIVVRRSYFDAARVRLERRATEGLIEVRLPLDRNELDALGADPDADSISVYDERGELQFGKGPLLGDDAVRNALDGDGVSTSSDDYLIVALPILDRNGEQPGGVIRVTEPVSAVDTSVRRAWAVMATAALGALALAWLVARMMARTISRPIQRLAEAATEFGAGAVVIAGEPTGIVELDQLDVALASSSVRVARLLGRERAFSADVSHQLRTPLTRLRISLETLAQTDGAAAEALTDVDHLQATVERLLALSRDSHPVGESIDVNTSVTDTRRRWDGRFGAVGRDLVLTPTDGLSPINASRAALDQVLDVLIDNALAHGSGTITVSSRAAPGGVAVEVSDEGHEVGVLERERIFTRHHGTGTGAGIGLALARSLAESEGGRLLLTDVTPTRFTLLFPVDAPPADVGSLDAVWVEPR